MAWSDTFKALLRDKDTPYRPRFRLIIGTPAISGTHMGKWEAGYAKVLEISSHPSSSSLALPFTTYGDGTWPTGHSYRYIVGLTGQIRTGAQAVTPRTWTYQGATLSVGVTREAASLADQLVIGTLSRLEMSLEDESVFPGTTQEISADTRWETIHIGQFKGMKWSGTSYTLDFNDALEAANGRTTEDHLWLGEGYLHQWFAGCGEDDTPTGGLKVGVTYTTTSGGTLRTNAVYDATHATRAGYTYKKRDSWPGGAFHYGDGDVDENVVNNWAIIVNTSGGVTYVQYEGIANSGGYLGLTNAESYAGPGRLPGYEKASVVGGIDENGTVRTACLLHGTPVTEIVNTIYVQGYHAQMVPGIFGESIGTMYSSPLNMSDLALAHNTFNDVFSDEADGGLLASARTTYPFRVVVASATDNGAAFIKKLTGKWGVFPRFKEGGYGAGVIVDEERREDSVHEHNVVTLDDIQGAEYNQSDSQITGIYKKLEFTSTDADLDTAELAAFTKQLQPAGHLPVLPSIAINQTEVAAGWNPAGMQYSDYYGTVLEQWWARPYHSCTLRLRGLKFAHLAPGDSIHVELASDSTTVPAWGPSGGHAGAGVGRSVLDTVVRFTPWGEIDLSQDQLASWLITSVAVDWVGCLVTVVATKVNLRGYSTDFAELPIDSNMSTRLGTAVGKLPHK